MSKERERLEEDRLKKRHWRRWGPYVSERQWGTVREDYSEDGDAWEYFPHDQARFRAYRWGEDGIGGFSDNHQRLCFAFAFWNEKDPILKERFFGLGGKEGNHGEDVKEYYFYLDATPTHSYMKMLYKYPQRAYPYNQLVEENRKRGQKGREFELTETGIFEGNRYFDITIEYAKDTPEDVFAKLTVHNLGPENAKIHILPTLWFRNTWDFGKKEKKPVITANDNSLMTEHEGMEKRTLYFTKGAELLFTDNDTHFQHLFGTQNASPYVKNAFHDYLIDGNKNAVNPANTGTKAGIHYSLEIPSKGSTILYFRLSDQVALKDPFVDVEVIFSKRKEEADAFYQEISESCKEEDLHKVQRQAYAGMLWNKQFYHYVVDEWLKGDSPPPPNRRNPRNADWIHLYNDDILSVPDKWEYPAFFSWDTAFHCLPLAILDPEFSKRQLTLLTREWYMHPNGQIPAYEWSFSDVNPPVHAWAAWRVYKIEKKMQGRTDRLFLESVFQKLLLNFTWWVNRKDADGKNVFQGGFLGLDNISIFNRSENLPQGGKLYQSDASSWMAMYCLNMLTIAFELAKEEPAYEDMASKFYEHFLYISDAINFTKGKGMPLWNEEDGFYYDVLAIDSHFLPVKVRSIVGLIPLFAVGILEPDVLKKLPGFTKRLNWFLENRGDLCRELSCLKKEGKENRRLLSILNPDRLKRVLEKVLDEKEFLSPFGIRSLSKYHQEHPFSLRINDVEYCVDYAPAESTSLLFGGNSNWRGPIWFPMNMLIIESLQKFHHYFGDDFKVECPTGSGKFMNLWDVSLELSKRLSSIFEKDKEGKRPVFGENPQFQSEDWKEYVLFYEYFHGENGAGLGASHQTGWTGLVAKLIQQLSDYKNH